MDMVEERVKEHDDCHANSARFLVKCVVLTESLKFLTPRLEAKMIGLRDIL